MTRHVLDLLPLWVEGDLDAPTQAAVDRHLADCPPCRRAAEDLRISQAWLREALDPPFEAGDHADLQAAVLAELQAPAAAPLPWRRPALLAAAATLLLAGLPWALRHPPLAGPAPAPAPSPSPPANPDPSRVSEPVREPAPPRPSSAARAPGAVRPSPPASPEGAPTRIEFRTADPSIRVIWLAQAAPATEPVPKEKS